MSHYAPLDLSKLVNVPKQLQGLPVWMLWKSVPSGKEKPQKIPYYVDGKPRGNDPDMRDADGEPLKFDLDSVEDRSRLVTMEEAVRVFNPKKWAGVSAALGPVPDTSLIVSGIDLDHSVRDGNISPKANRIVEAAGAYAEISPSRTGLKIFGLNDIGEENDPKAGLEIYSGGRHFTITGDRIGDDGRLADLTEAAALARATLLKQQEHLQARDDGGLLEGSRNKALFEYARILWAKEMPEPDRQELYQRRAKDCRPLLEKSELKSIYKSAKKFAQKFTLTDLGNRDRLVRDYSEDLRYLIGEGWHVWNGQRFEPDDARHVIVLMGNVTKGIYAEAAAHTGADDSSKAIRIATSNWAKTSESRTRIEAAVALSESHPAVVDRIENFDVNPALIGLRNGVYDLQRGEFRKALREDRITKQMNVEYDANAKAPRWERFQSEIHGGDAEMIAFKHRLWGYTASGDTSEQKFFTVFGEGENGKGTEQETMAAIMGDYALAIEPEVLAKKDRVAGTNAASSDIAEMRGRRFIYTSELEEGHQLAEKLIKRLTGQDTIRARFLYKERLSYIPVAKFWISTNHKPEIKGTDHAIWRRVCLIPYVERFDGAKKDKTLRATLLAERAGIFNWLVHGYRAWREGGLNPPKVVTSAGAEYRSDQDRIGTFIRECCALKTGHTLASEVYRTYTRWSKNNGMFPLSAKKFHDHMERDHKLQRVAGDAGRNSDYKDLLLVTHAYDNVQGGSDDINGA